VENSWKCPKCGKEYDISNEQYLKALELQHFVEMMSGCDEKIKAICWSCNFRELQ
jgi:predicted nucleic-acid-binding Zn-ribbon protein